MLRSLYRFMLGLTAVASLFVGSTALAAVPRINDDEPAAVSSRDWRGGPVSLPIGRGHGRSEILAAASELPQAQELIASFTERGYIRRVDQDQAGSTDSIAYAFLAWEKPGVPTLSEAPVIRILSKAYFEPEVGQKVVATQAFAGVLRDSSGTLTTYQSGPDAPILVGEVVPIDTPGAIVLDPGKLASTNMGPISYRLAAREKMGQAVKLAKDTWKASCPWVKTISRYTIIGGAAAAGTTQALSGNVWGAVGLAIASDMATQWIENKWTCAK